MALSERVIRCYGWFKLGAFYRLAGRQTGNTSKYMWLCSAEDPHITFKIVRLLIRSIT